MEQVPVKGWWFAMARLCRPRPTELPGTAAVIEVLAAEARQRETMRMTDDGIGNGLERPALGKPTPAELAILRCGEDEALIETTEGKKVIAVDGQIVGGKERGERSLRTPGMARRPIEDGIEEALAGGGVEIGGERIDDAAAEQRAGVVLGSAQHGRQPVRLRQAIVIEKEEELSLCPCGTGIAGTGGTLVWLPEMHGAILCSDCFKRSRAAIFDHDNLVGVGRKAARAKGGQAGFQNSGMAEGRDNDSGGRRHESNFCTSFAAIFAESGSSLVCPLVRSRFF